MYLIVEEETLMRSHRQAKQANQAREALQAQQAQQAQQAHQAQQGPQGQETAGPARFAGKDKTPSDKSKIDKMKELLSLEEKKREEKKEDSFIDEAINKATDFFDDLIPDISSKPLDPSEINQIDDVIDEYRTLHDEHQKYVDDMDEKVSGLQDVIDSKESNFRELLDQKNRENVELRAQVVNVNKSLAKFKETCQKKVQAIQVLEEENDAEDLKDNKEVFNHVVEMFNERIKECRGKVREKDGEMKDFFDFVQEQPDNVMLKKKKKRTGKKK